MFRKNQQHLQSHLISELDNLSPQARMRLEGSWAGTFRRELFMRLDEIPFAALYAEQPSRPNVPVNVLLALEVLKAGFGWTDEELYDAFLFDLQVRYAVGYEELSAGYFAIRTLYEFRQRIREHLQTQGVNLLEQAFAQVTDEQRAALKLKSDKLRMDSTQVASNIYEYSRLHLLVEILQRVQRMLGEAEQAHYASLLEAYVESESEHYIYRLNRTELDQRLATIGPVMATLVAELAAGYGTEPTYLLLVRVFGEHFAWSEQELQPKPFAKLGNHILQSPDDPEATYYRKRGKGYRGYVANVTETCDSENALQLIVHVQAEPNVTDDAQLLLAAVPTLVARTEVKELYTDGGYNSPQIEPLLAETKIAHHQSALRGDHPAADGISLVNFTITTDSSGTPVMLVCPQGQSLPVLSGKNVDRFIARPDPATCNDCPLLSRCAVRPNSTSKTPTLYFSLRECQVALKRQAIAARPPNQGNLRAAVEATIRSIKHPFRQGKLPVRGKFRMLYLLLSSAFMINLRRIHRYVMAKLPQLPTPWLVCMINTLYYALSCSLRLLYRITRPPLRLYRRRGLFASSTACFSARPCVSASAHFSFEFSQ